MMSLMIFVKFGSNSRGKAQYRQNYAELRTAATLGLVCNGISFKQKTQVSLQHQITEVATGNVRNMMKSSEKIGF